LATKQFTKQSLRKSAYERAYGAFSLLSELSKLIESPCTTYLRKYNEKLWHICTHITGSYSSLAASLLQMLRAAAPANAVRRQRQYIFSDHLMTQKILKACTRNIIARNAVKDLRLHIHILVAQKQ
jgi:hypothetical protein